MAEPGPRRRRRIAFLAAPLALLVTAALVIAYAWEPPTTRYESPYLASIQSQYVETPVARFHYTETGHGSPVVLIAGGGLWLYSYRHTIPALAQDHTVYAVDLPGQGYTTLKDRHFSYDLDSLSGAIGSFLDAVGLRSASIVGQSWGGAWSMYFAERHPDRVNQLALIDSTGLDTPSILTWRLMGYPVVGELIGKLMTKSQAASTLRMAFAHSDRVTQQVVDEDWAPMSRPEGRRALWLSQRNLDYRLTQQLMGQLHIPTLIVWGGEDQFDKPWEASEMAHRIPGATAHVLPGCGHNAHEDCPDQVNALLTGFLNVTSGSAAQS